MPDLKSCLDIDMYRLLIVDCSYCAKQSLPPRVIYINYII